MRREGLGKTEFSKNNVRDRKKKALNKYTNCIGQATRKTMKETH